MAEPIRLPHHFTPREYQLPFLAAMDGGKRRAVLVDHRRCGKDKAAFNFTVKEMFTRVGAYYYFFPTYNQGRKIIWDGKDKAGFPFLGHIPAKLIKAQNATEMKLTTINDSILQVVGSDNIDSIVGSNPIGCVFSEYALQDPKGWDFVRPILRENGGWAIFPYTPRGKNHGWDLYQMAKNNPEWYCETLTIDDTFGRGGTVGPADIEEERRAGMSENLIQQEYYVSFDAAVEHAVFGSEMWKCREEKRITSVPWVASLPVNTYWDIGWDDATAIWFEQTVMGEVRLIDFYQARQKKLSDFIKMLREKPYIYGTHYMPHDAGQKRMATGQSTQEVGWDLGLDTEIVPKISEEDQINAARTIFNRCWFDEKKSQEGLDALSSYHFEYDTEKRILSSTPRHDWSSHPSKAFELLAVAHREELNLVKNDRYTYKAKRRRSFMAA